MRYQIVAAWRWTSIRLGKPHTASNTKENAIGTIGKHSFTFFDTSERSLRDMVLDLFGFGETIISIRVSGISNLLTKYYIEHSTISNTLLVGRTTTVSLHNLSTKTIPRLYCDLEIQAKLDRVSWQLRFRGHCSMWISLWVLMIPGYFLIFYLLFHSIATQILV